MQHGTVNAWNFPLNYSAENGLLRSAGWITESDAKHGFEHQVLVRQLLFRLVTAQRSASLHVIVALMT